MPRASARTAPALSPLRLTRRLESGTRKQASRLAHRCAHKAEVRAASFSPDGARIVTASDDKTARIWDAKTGQQMTTFRGHTNAVNSAVWSPDGAAGAHRFGRQDRAALGG